MSNHAPAGPAGPVRPGRPAPPIRLAAFDLDGTLLGPGPEAGEEVKAALGDLAAAGVVIAIVTGRMTSTAEELALEMGLAGHPLISFNGAVAKFVGHAATLWNMPIHSDLALSVIDYLEGGGYSPLVFIGGDRVYAGADGEGARRYGAVSGAVPVVVPSLAALVSSGDEGAETGQRPGPLSPTKILQVEDPASMPGLLSEATSRFGRDLQITTSYPFFLEFMNKDVTKGRALARVSRRLGISRSEVAAFGDGMNDLDMIQWAGLGVAMGHGPEKLREAADEVVDGPPGEALAGFLRLRLLGGAAAR